jgi:hypothetical protein
LLLALLASPWPQRPSAQCSIVGRRPRPRPRACAPLRRLRPARADVLPPLVGGARLPGGQGLGRRLPTVLGVRAAVDQKVARRWLVGGVVWPRCARPHQLSRGGVMLLRLPKGWRDGGPWLRGRRNAPQASTADRPPRRQGLFSLCAVAAFPNSRSSESCIELKRDVFVRFLANCGSLLGRCSPPPWRHPSFLSPLSGPLLQIRAAARGPKIFPDSLDRWLILQKIRVFFGKWIDA